jgi:hypothetical protein
VELIAIGFKNTSLALAAALLAKLTKGGLSGGLCCTAIIRLHLWLRFGLDAALWLMNGLGCLEGGEIPHAVLAKCDGTHGLVRGASQGSLANKAADFLDVFSTLEGERSRRRRLNTWFRHQR